MNYPASNYLDLLYLNKNKAYGSYDLRKNYSKRSLIALGIVCFITISLTILHQLNGPEATNKNAIVHAPEVILKEISLPPLKEQATASTPATKKEVQKKAGAPKAMSMHRFTEPKIVSNDAVEPKDKIDVDKLQQDIAAGPKDHHGDTDATTYNPNAQANDNGGGDTALVVSNNKPPSTPVDNQIHRSVHKKPQYNGNVQAFLKQHLKYPPKALEAGITGKVIVEFIVDKAGKISNAKAISAIGGGCEEEAVRVVKQMHGWAPAIKNDIPVDSYFTVAVHFNLK